MKDLLAGATGDLLGSRCTHRTDALTDEEVGHCLGLTPGWSMRDGKISKNFSFKNYYQTLAFVNAAAYVVHTENHHPDIRIGYSDCTIEFHTHSVNDGRGGLSLNDFICAAKIDAVFRQSFD